jgi:hypothetical protein
MALPVCCISLSADRSTTCGFNRTALSHHRIPASFMDPKCVAPWKFYGIAWQSFYCAHGRYSI